GHAYQRNAATADVFVRAMYSRVSNRNKNRRDSVMPNTGEDGNYITIPQSDSDHIVIRARVVPYSMERKPFLIQRRFSKADMEASRPIMKDEEEAEEDKSGRSEKSDGDSGKVGERGKGESEEKSPAQVTPEEPSSTPGPQTSPRAKPSSPEKETPEPTATGLKKRVMPIHMDYALKYLPILGAIMRSGDIRRGDTIDMPLPHPEAWSDTITPVVPSRAGPGAEREIGICSIDKADLTDDGHGLQVEGLLVSDEHSDQ
ncbi:hypothetical protein V491_06785, partial [Pseudogymnoascus sp. VKM F-3775]